MTEDIPQVQNVESNDKILSQSVVPTPSSVSAAKKNRIIRWLLLATLVVFIAGSAFAGTLVYKRLGYIAPAELLPKDTLALVVVANYQKDDAENPWLRLQSLLHYFPLAENLKIDDSAAAYRRAIAQTLGGTVALDKLPELGKEISVALTYLPDSAKKLSLLISPSNGQVAGITSDTQAASLPIATPQAIAPTDIPGLLVFIPLQHPTEILSLLRTTSDESLVSVEAVPGEQMIYQLTPKNKLEESRKIYTPLRTVYATLIGRQLVFSLRLEDIKGVIDRSSLFNFVNNGNSFASVKAYQNIAKAAANERSLSWYVTQDPFQNPAKLFSFFAPTTNNQTTTAKNTNDYLTGRIVIEKDGIRLYGWYPTLASTKKLAPTAQQQNLISLLPEKILGQWVSFYVEQSDVDGILNWSMKEGGDIQNTLHEVGQEVLGLDFDKEILPALSGRIAFMLAPRYDGAAPYPALILQSTENGTELKSKVDKAFSSIQTAWDKKLNDNLEQNRKEIEQYKELYGKSGMPLPSYIEKLRTTPAQVERTEEQFRNVTIVTLHTPNDQSLLNFQQISYAVDGNNVVISTETQATKELLDSLKKQGPFPPLLQTALVQNQLQRHPQETTHFTYLYPQGIVGILKWILCGSGGLCQVGEPQTEAIAEMISSHLLVTKTLGTSFTEQDGGAAETVFLQLAPLDSSEHEKFTQAAKQLGISDQQLSETSASAGGLLEEIVGSLFKQSITSSDNGYSPGSQASPQSKANDSRIKSDVGQLRTLAEVYYDSNKASYAGIDKCFSTPSPNSCKDSSVSSSVQSLKDDLADAIGSSANLEVNATSSEFCISHSLKSDSGSFVCVDSTGVFNSSPTATCGAEATKCPK